MRSHLIVFALMVCGCSAPSSKPAANAPTCDPPARVGMLPAELPEASGVAISRQHTGILWVHNDDAPLTLYGIDSTGAIRARVHVPVVADADIEDIAVAPCGNNSCIYIADTGDNKQERTDRSVYRITEPALTDTLAVPNARYRFHMPGKSLDTEALFVMPDGRMFVITKGRSGPITLYEFPNPPSAMDDVALKPAFELSAGLVQLPDLVTGAGVTPDGSTIVVRTYSAFQLYSLQNDTLRSLLPKPYNLEALNEPQGEGVDIRADGTLFFVGERGISDANAPISRVHCELHPR